MKRRSFCQYFANAAGIGIPLLGLLIIIGHTDLTADGNVLAVSVLRASFDAGGQLDVTDGGWQHIVGLAAVAIVALVHDIGDPHHQKLLSDRPADPLGSHEPSVIADPARAPVHHDRSTAKRSHRMRSIRSTRWRRCR